MFKEQCKEMERKKKNKQLNKQEKCPKTQISIQISYSGKKI